MIILTIKTDQPTAQIALFKDEDPIEVYEWQGHRALAETLHLKLAELLERNSIQLKEINGLVAYEGPGSFTGLRIGIAVVNTLAYALPADAVGSGGENWQQSGIKRLLAGESEAVVLPEYGAEVRITPQKK